MQEPVVSSKMPKKVPTKKWLLIGCAVLLLVVVCGVFAFLQHKKKRDREEQETTHLLKERQENNDDSQQNLITCAAKDENQWYRTDHTFAIDPKSPSTMYVYVEYKGLYKSIDSGATWQKKDQYLPTEYTDATTKQPCQTERTVLRIDPTDSNHLLLTGTGSPGTLKDINSKTGGVYQSTDAGETWTQAITDSMNTYVAYALEFDPHDAKTFYYGTSAAPASYQEADQNKIFVTKGLLYQTKDAGKNWQELPTGFLKNTRLTRLFIDPADSKHMRATTITVEHKQTGPNTVVPEQMGIIETTDEGASWKRIDNLPKGFDGVLDADVAAKNYDHMFINSAVDPEKDKPRSYFSIDGGKTFTQSSQFMDLAQYDPFDATGNRLIGYAWQGKNELTLYQSLDAGRTWASFGTLPKEIKAIGDHKTRVQYITWHPTDKNTFFLTGANGFIWKTTDNGQTWATLASYETLP